LAYLNWNNCTCGQKAAFDVATGTTTGTVFVRASLTLTSGTTTGNHEGFVPGNT
jgi:hypothetical protein